VDKLPCMALVHFMVLEQVMMLLATSESTNPPHRSNHSSSRAEYPPVWKLAGMGASISPSYTDMGPFLLREWLSESRLGTCPPLPGQSCEVLSCFIFTCLPDCLRSSLRVLTRIYPSFILIKAWLPYHIILALSHSCAITFILDYCSE
jgi:hypothetical protein